MNAYRTHSDVTYVDCYELSASSRCHTITTHLSRRGCLILRNSSECFSVVKEYPPHNLMQTIKPVVYAFSTDEERTRACLFIYGTFNGSQ